MKLGADDFLIKPFEADDLNSRCRNRRWQTSNISKLSLPPTTPKVEVVTEDGFERFVKFPAETVE